MPIDPFLPGAPESGLRLILPGLWLGDFDSALNAQQLQRHNIQFMVSCLRPTHSHLVLLKAALKATPSLDPQHFLLIMDDLPMQRLDSVTRGAFVLLNRWLSPVFTETTQAWLQAVGRCHTHRRACAVARQRAALFCASAPARKHGNVLIHSLSGISRAPALIIAYIILAYHVSFSSAYALVAAAQPAIRPNYSFISQLGRISYNLFLTCSEDEVFALPISHGSDPHALPPQKHQLVLGYYEGELSSSSSDDATTAAVAAATMPKTFIYFPSTPERVHFALQLLTPPEFEGGDAT